MAKISREEVETIAELAKLTLSDEEKLMFQEQLSSVLEYAEMLQQLDTSDIPPTTSAIPLFNVMRADEVRLSLDNEDALANAPDAADRSFRVKAVLD
ncbi:MAG: Glutamyl-tRNA(Gln) amidotransferase subunit C [Anaerolineae bacterium]|nr:Glutamyl-tRNA(Gln) amidotransferase subunit C [Anaerolineae bacterium]